MTKNKHLSIVLDRLVEAYHPLSIYLYGSYAWGNPNEQSDLDMLIVVDTSDEPSYRRPVKGYHALFGLNVDTEIVVKTKSEFETSVSDVTSLTHKIKKDGKLLYAKP